MEDYIRQKLVEDFEFYSQHCLKIKHKVTTRITPFILNSAQKILLAERNRQLKERGFFRGIILKGRQQGISTVIGGIGFQKVTQSLGKSAFILSHESKATQNLFKMVKQFHDYCPPEVLPTLTSDSQKELEYKGIRSGYSVGTAGSRATGRSLNLQFFHGSEVAFWDNAADHASGVMNAILAEGQGTEVYLESTANGMGNYFHEQWQTAVDGDSSYAPIFIPWFLQPEYAVSDLPDGWTRTDEEVEMMKRYNVNDYQLAWRRVKIKELTVAGVKGETLFKQEFPFYPDEAFQMTGKKGLISPDDVMKARNNVGVQANGARIMGIDGKGTGDDKFAISVRQGRRHLATEFKNGAETRTLGERINFCIKMIREWNPDAIFVDAGYGADLVDRLQDMVSNPIHLVHFGGSALDDVRFFNKRAEMYGLANEWLTRDDVLVHMLDNDMLQAHLCATLYKFDTDNRLKIVDKEIIKKELGVSPDLSDSFVLTFAEPVIVHGGYNQKPIIRGRI